MNRDGLGSFVLKIHELNVSLCLVACDVNKCQNGNSIVTGIRARDICPLTVRGEDDRQRVRRHANRSRSAGIISDYVPLIKVTIRELLAVRGRRPEGFGCELVEGV